LLDDEGGDGEGSTSRGRSMRLPDRWDLAVLPGCSKAWEERRVGVGVEPAHAALIGGGSNMEGTHLLAGGEGGGEGGEEERG
jgi:hypothetical protein